MNASGVEKIVQIGAPEEEQNQALAVAKTQSSMSEDTPNGTSKLGCLMKTQKRSLRNPREHRKRPRWHHRVNASPEGPKWKRCLHRGAWCTKHLEAS